MRSSTATMHALALPCLLAPFALQDAIEPNSGGELDLESHAPEVALQRLEPAAGYSVNLFASEVDFPIANPVAMTFDARGRLWVLTMPGYPHAVPGEAPNDQLVILEDTDGDGAADRHTVFADGLYLPTGFELGDGGAYVAQQPNLVHLRDTNGDDVADERRVLLHGFGTEDSHHAISAFTWGPNGGLYFQEGTFHHTQVETPWGVVRCVDGGTFRWEPLRHFLEVFVSYPYLNPWGHVFDRWGQNFLADASDGSNYFALPLSGRLPYPAKHPRTGSFTSTVRPTGNCEIVSSRHFPAEVQGDFLITNVIGFHGVMQHRRLDAGSGFAAERVGPLLWSSDLNFRPVDLQFGPDGALYVVDWFNPLIGHMQYSLRDPRRDRAHGRVWRVTARDRPLLEPVAIAGKSPRELVQLLSTPEDRVRYRVRRELREHAPDAALAAVRAWLAELEELDPLPGDALRLEALWATATVGAVDRELLGRLLESADTRVRAAAVRTLRHARHLLDAPLDSLAVAARDEHPRVRLEALVAASWFDEPGAVESALVAVERESDPFLDYALPETIRGLEPVWRQALLSGEPFATEQPRGLAYLLARLESAELPRVAPSETLDEEILTRHDTSDEQFDASLARLTSTRQSDGREELIAAIARIDAAGGAHAEHALSRIYRRLLSEDPAVLRFQLDKLEELAGSTSRASTRQFVGAARIVASGSVDAAWQAALESRGALTDLLDAAPSLPTHALREEMHARIAELATAGEDAEAVESSRGRYVRIDLPGESRTLTLAEVEVLHNGINIAPEGTATQSSVAWSGSPSRAIDGNTSGTFGDGGQTHTVEGQPEAWWELDLGRERQVDAIEIWNRTDGTFGRRLDGFVLSLLDSERRAVYRTEVATAPLRNALFDLSSPGLWTRRAATRALGRLGVRETRTVSMLIELFDSPPLRAAALEGLHGIPAKRWTQQSIEAFAIALIEWTASASPAERGSSFARSLRALGEELAARLGRGSAKSPDAAPGGDDLRRVLRSLGPRVIQIRPLRDEMLFDKREVTVEAGREVELVFENTDLMPHNLLVTAPGALATVGLAAERMAKEPDAWSRAFVPASPLVLHATRLLQPGESQTLSFTAPAEPGDYPYVCTFPGHWIRMNGVLHVVRDNSAQETAPSPVTTSTEVPRTFVRSWGLDDIAALVQVDASVTDAERVLGRQVFEGAACVRCHRFDNSGGDTGPDLSEVADRLDVRVLLEEILEPSARIAAEYRQEIFVTTGGQVLAGQVIDEDGERVRLRSDPYRSSETVELAVEEIEERVASDLSVMPSGLLNTFSADEIRALVAFLASHGQ